MTSGSSFCNCNFIAYWCSGDLSGDLSEWVPDSSSVFQSSIEYPRPPPPKSVVG